MTTYLVKKTDGQPLHFRVTLEEQILRVVEGQFYNWITEWSSNAGTNEKAKQEAAELIQTKLDEGYKKELFQATKENTFNVYDKAKWHYDGEFPEDIDEFQGFVHTGMYIAWLIEHDLLNKAFFEDEEDFVLQVKNRTLTGAEFYEQCMDGVLLLEEVSETGNKFSLEYFDFDDGKYLSDYEQTLALSLPSIYHVQDTWENYTKLKKVIDRRFSEWQSKGTRRPFWKFWQRKSH